MRDGMLEFKDAPMFGRVMRDPEICKGVLERILGFQIERIEYLSAEEALDPATEAKGVRLDVFAKGSGRVFDIEMQVGRDRDLDRRMRYYQASIDHVCLGKGESYSQLPESYVIFICDFDAYAAGLPAYHLERTCAEDPRIQLTDGSHWLVLNASAWDKDEDGARARLLEYVHTNEAADDGLVRQIEGAVIRANTDAAWRESAMGFMTVEHHRRAQMDSARLAGIREGREEGLREGVDQGLEQGLEQGRKQYAALVDALLDAGRIEDLQRAAQDDAYQQSLLEEFHII